LKWSYSAPEGPSKGHKRAGEGAVSALEKEGRKEILMGNGKSESEWGPKEDLEGPHGEPRKELQKSPESMKNKPKGGPRDGAPNGAQGGPRR
jgi:hypothetical protein